MTREAFIEELLGCLKAHRQRCPEGGAQDAAKFVFQGMLGVGHLLGAPEAVEDYLCRETEGLRPDGEEPLTEPLSPDWCRLNLRRALAEQLPLRMIARLMRLEHPASGFGREDAAQVCRALAAAEGNAELDRLAEQMRDAGWLPSHSEEYRRNYAPAYRVIPAVWAPLLPVLCRIAREYAAAERVLVTVDGPCASGKTTLAGMLAEALEAPVLHTDDYVVPHAAKTPQRLAIPGGNCDWERLTKEVLLPWLLGEEAEIRRYDCGADCLLPPEVLPPVPLLLLEGSYVNLPAIRACADVRLFVDAPGPVRMARLARRESPESLARFHARWIPLEEAYFRAYGLPDDGCLIIRCGAGEVPPDRAD